MEVKVEGLTELRDLLQRKLPDEIQTKALQSTLAKAAKPIVSEARARVPVRTGALRRAITSGRSRKSTKVRAVRVIGVNAKKINRPATENGRSRWIDRYYWKQIEFGRPAYSSRRNLGTPEKGFFGKRFKAVPARPFLRPAFEARKFDALEAFRKNMATEIDKAAARLNRQSLNRLRRKVFGA